MRMDKDGKKRMAYQVLQAVLPFERGFRAFEISEMLSPGKDAPPLRDGAGSPAFWDPDPRRVGEILDALVRRGILTKTRHRVVVTYAVARWWTY